MMVGPVADKVVPDNEERAFPESQVRRHKAARWLSDRCRMILSCADSLPGKEGAARPGVHEHTGLASGGGGSSRTGWRG